MHRHPLQPISPSPIFPQAEQNTISSPSIASACDILFKFAPALKLSSPSDIDDSRYAASDASVDAASSFVVDAMAGNLSCCLPGLWQDVCTTKCRPARRPDDLIFSSNETSTSCAEMKDTPLSVPNATCSCANSSPNASQSTTPNLPRASWDLSRPSRPIHQSISLDCSATGNGVVCMPSCTRSRRANG